MKIAVTSNGNSSKSEASTVFGRCPYFIIADVENGEIRNCISEVNPAKNETGAGNKAAEFIANKEVKALISGSVGPNAFNILKQVGIKIYKLESGTVMANLELFNKAKLEEIVLSSSGGPGSGGRMGRMGQR
jgi:predicted Fe-Mo cluster-binding NifX family protein